MASILSRLSSNCSRLAIVFAHCPKYRKPNHSGRLKFPAPSIFKTMSSSPVEAVKTIEKEDLPTPLQSSDVSNLKKPDEITEINPEVVSQQKEVPVGNENTTDEAKPSDTNNEVEVKTPYIRIKKRKVVLLMSYSGQGFYGMQKNPDTRTIEDELLKALLKATYIDEESYKKPQTLNFQRAARTDKNVSAARQIVSLKLPDEVDLSKVNEFLPEQIRVMGLKRVTRGFDSKSSCDGRTYMYMMPTFAFVPIDGQVTEDYRITPEVLEQVRKTLKIYLGTKNFHNFTSRRKATDPSSNRYILDFTCSDPFIKDGLEYVILRVRGQSFMLHQIRKMIGLATAILRGFADMSTFDKTWTPDRIDIPKAPGVGLVLDQVHYDRYNERFGSDGIHEKLTWDEQNEEIEKFCDEFVYPVITKTENEEKSMLTWLETLVYHSYDIRDHGTPSQLTPIAQAAALISKDKVGEDNSSDDEDDDDDDDGGSGRRPKSKRRKVFFKH